MLKWLELPLYFYSLGVTFFLWIFFWIFFGNFFVVYIFPWIWNISSIFFPTIITKLKTIETKKTCWLGHARWGVIQLCKLKISPNWFSFTFTKGKKCKKTHTSLKYMLHFFFQICVINQFYYCMIHHVKQIWSW
jgi:hypothetical protein